MKKELYYVERSVVEDKDDDQKPNESKLLSEFRSIERYVLLGEPGAGKTTAFEHEANESGNKSAFVTARIFIEWSHNEHEGKTLFIDGLDEAVAISGNRTPLSEVRKQLRRFNIQKYRISCRAADWNGHRDKHDFETVNGSIVELHLQGLTEENVKTILKNDNRVNDANDFYQQAGSNQLGNFLSNPQTLDMLIEATEGGLNWPNSKQQLYQKACEVLSRENNPEHLDSPAAKFLTEELLEGAGELYAYMLIASGQSFTTYENNENGIISLPVLGIKNDQPHYAALKTRLFNPISHHTYSPIHRSIAEYLAAKYLVAKLKQGLSLRRCFALITGFDGGPVAALRGLYAWLGTLSDAARVKVIETDVLGLVQYGDVSQFSVDEKVTVIQALKKESNDTGYLSYREGKSFAALTTPEMAQQLSILLSRNAQAKVHQSMLDVVLTGLFYAPPIKELKPLLIEIVHDERYEEILRLDALMVIVEKDYANDDELFLMAEAIKNKQIQDDNYRLQSFLLSHLYPNKISPQQVFDYAEFDQSNSTEKHNYWMFWDYRFYERIRDEEIPILLDALFARNEALTAYRGNDASILKLAGKLLSRGLELYGEAITNARLFEWLNIGVNKGFNRFETEVKTQIQSWMQHHNHRFLPLFEIGFEQLNVSQNVRYEISRLERSLYINPPLEMSGWWLNKSLNVQDFSFAEECFIRAYWAKNNETQDSNQVLDFFESWTAKNAQFIQAYERLTYCRLDEFASMHADEKKWKAEHQLKRQSQREQLLKHLVAIEEGKAYPAIYADIASNYCQHYNTEELDEARLKDFVCEDEALLNAAKKGLMKIIYRTDLPEIEDIFKAKAKQQPYFICLPFLLSLSIHYKDSPEILDTLSKNQVLLALAFGYSHNGGESFPKWFNLLQLKYPAQAADVFIKFVRMMLKAKTPYFQYHAVLGYKREEPLEKIARIVALPLLRDYPVKSLADTSTCLERLLKTALRNKSEVEQLQALIEEKLSKKSMDVQQKVFWIATGFLMHPERYQQQLIEYVSDSLERRAYLATFLYPYGDDIVERFNLPVSALAVLIRLMGNIASPRWSGDSTRRLRVVTNNMHNGELVQWLIEKLAEDTSSEATNIVKELLVDHILIEWHSTLKTVLQKQLANRREAEYRHPTSSDVADTVKNTKPANVADLAAMVLDFLGKLQLEMHKTAFNDYKNYWNDDSHSRLTTPKVENTGARYLAKQLKDYLSEFDVEVNSESLAPDDNRTDIRLTYHRDGKRLNLPVEIKRSFHEKLWSAINEQLIKLYTIEPDTQGRGIYLVLWFGAESKFNVTAKDGGNKPKTAAELQTRLVATMSPEQQKLIDVVVLDVSQPG
jgi:hypothetical protein